MLEFDLSEEIYTEFLNLSVSYFNLHKAQKRQFPRRLGSYLKDFKTASERLPYPPDASVGYAIIGEYLELSEDNKGSWPCLVQFSHSLVVTLCQQYEHLLLTDEESRQNFSLVMSHEDPNSMAKALQILQDEFSLVYQKGDNYRQLLSKHPSPQTLMHVLELLQRHGLIRNQAKAVFHHPCVDSLYQALAALDGSAHPNPQECIMLVLSQNHKPELACQAVMMLNQLGLLHGFEGYFNFKELHAHPCLQDILSGLTLLNKHELLKKNLTSHYFSKMIQHPDPAALAQALEMLDCTRIIRSIEQAHHGYDTFFDLLMDLPNPISAAECLNEIEHRPTNEDILASDQYLQSLLLPDSRDQPPLRENIPLIRRLILLENSAKYFKKFHQFFKTFNSLKSKISSYNHPKELELYPYYFSLQTCRSKPTRPIYIVHCVAKDGHKNFDLFGLYDLGVYDKTNDKYTKLSSSRTLDTLAPPARKPGHYFLSQSQVEKLLRITGNRHLKDFSDLNVPRFNQLLEDCFKMLECTIGSYVILDVLNSLIQKVSQHPIFNRWQENACLQLTDILDNSGLSCLLASDERLFKHPFFIENPYWIFNVYHKLYDLNFFESDIPSRADFLTTLVNHPNPRGMEPLLSILAQNDLRLKNENQEFWQKLLSPDLDFLLDSEVQPLLLVFLPKLSLQNRYDVLICDSKLDFIKQLFEVIPIGPFEQEKLRNLYDTGVFSQPPFLTNQLSIECLAQASDLLVLLHQQDVLLRPSDMKIITQYHQKGLFSDMAYLFIWHAIPKEQYTVSTLQEIIDCRRGFYHEVTTLFEQIVILRQYVFDRWLKNTFEQDKNPQDNLLKLYQSHLLEKPFILSNLQKIQDHTHPDELVTLLARLQSGGVELSESAFNQLLDLEAFTTQAALYQLWGQIRLQNLKEAWPDISQILEQENDPFEAFKTYVSEHFSHQASCQSEDPYAYKERNKNHAQFFPPAAPNPVIPSAPPMLIEKPGLQ